MTFLEIRENILDYIDEWKLNPDNWLSMFLKDTVFEITLSHQGYLYLSYFCEKSSALQVFKKIKFSKAQAAYEAEEMNEYLDLVLLQKLKDVEKVICHRYFSMVSSRMHTYMNTSANAHDFFSAADTSVFPQRDPVITLQVSKSRQTTGNNSMYISYEYAHMDLDVPELSLPQYLFRRAFWLGEYV
jgi:hypothetical protein